MGSSLLDLPAELRIAIYGSVISVRPPYASASHYTGLLRSCSLIRREFAHELLKEFKAYIGELQKRIQDQTGQPLKINMPTNLKEMRTLTIWRDERYILFWEDSQSSDLLRLDLDKLIIKSFRPDDYTKPYSIQDHNNKSKDQRNVLGIAETLAQRSAWTTKSCPTQIICDWSYNPQQKENLVDNARDRLRRYGVWQLDLKEEKSSRAEVLGVLFDRLNPPNPKPEIKLMYGKRQPFFG